MRILPLAAFFCLLVIISAKKQHNENIDEIVEPESKIHSTKKYSKEHQKSHHHNHKHKKHTVEEELGLETEPEKKAKKAPIEIPEPEIELQENLETSKKAVADERNKEQLLDLHLQDLAYEENLKKEKRKKGHHGAHRADVLEKNSEKAEKKLFAEQESKHAVDEKVIEDSFEPLNEPKENGKHSKKSKDKKSKDKGKDKSKNKKKAYEKNEKSKDKYNKKSKDGKKNKDKKYNKKEKRY